MSKYTEEAIEKEFEELMAEANKEAEPVAEEAVSEPAPIEDSVPVESEVAEPVPTEDAGEPIDLVAKIENEVIDPSNELKAKAEQLRVKLAEYDLELQRINQSVQFPTGGIFEHQGKDIYRMSTQELNDYLTVLYDSGRIAEATQIQAQREKAFEAAREYNTRQQEREQLAAEQQQLADQAEWVEIQREYEKQLPGLQAKDLELVAQHIGAQMDSNPIMKAKALTRVGKHQLVIDALRQTGIAERINKEQQNARLITKPPVAPDASASSKSVKVTNTPEGRQAKLAALESLSQAEFNRIPLEEIEAAMEAAKP